MTELDVVQIFFFDFQRAQEQYIRETKEFSKAGIPQTSEN